MESIAVLITENVGQELNLIRLEQTHFELEKLGRIDGIL